MSCRAVSVIGALGSCAASTPVGATLRSSAGADVVRAVCASCVVMSCRAVSVIGALGSCAASTPVGATLRSSAGADVVCAVCGSCVVMSCLLRHVVVALDVCLEQTFEERAVVHERLALRLYTDIALFLCEVKRVSGPVVLDDIGVIDRHVCDALVEVID